MQRIDDCHGKNGIDSTGVASAHQLLETRRARHVVPSSSLASPAGRPPVSRRAARDRAAGCSAFDGAHRRIGLPAPPRARRRRESRGDAIFEAAFRLLGGGGRSTYRWGTSYPPPARANRTEHCGGSCGDSCRPGTCRQASAAYKFQAIAIRDPRLGARADPPFGDDARFAVVMGLCGIVMSQALPKADGARLDSRKSIRMNRPNGDTPR